MSRITVHNPGTGELLGDVAALTDAEVAAAIETATAAQSAMAAMPAHARAELLLRIAALIEAELPSLSTLLAAENGKPITQTRGEVAAAVRIPSTISPSSHSSDRPHSERLVNSERTVKQGRAAREQDRAARAARGRGMRGRSRR